MPAHYSIILQAYRAALADWAARELEGRRSEDALIGQAASLASIWTNDSITENDVVDVLKTRH